MKYDSIEFLKGVENFELVTAGYSGADKKVFSKNGKKYFLKIGHFKLCENLESLMNKVKIPHPKIIDSGVFSKDTNYIIEEFSRGTDFKKEFDNYDPKFIYEFAFEIGKQYSHLRTLHPDKPLSKGYIKDHQIDVQERIEELKREYQNKKTCLKKEEQQMIDFTIDYLKNNFNLFKKSNLVFGHCDIKPSNFLLHDGHLIATDIEHTDYKELSLSMIWSYARSDMKDEKNLAFTKGYLDGLYNLNPPKNILAAFNYTYMFNVARFIIENLKSEKYEKLSRILLNIKNRYIEDDKVILDHLLISQANLKYMPKLKGYDFELVRGSYNPYNLTFKCTFSTDTLFLKVMKQSDKKYKKALISYKLLESAGIPTSPCVLSGCIAKDKYYYVAFNFINYKDMAYYREDLDFDDGLKYGQMVASYLIKLKGKKDKHFRTFDKENLRGDILSHLDQILNHPNYRELLGWSKEETINYINHYIESFNDESIDLIHADVKFDNILHDGKNKIIFVDNENLMYSYDTINFLYNIQNGFIEEQGELYRGFVVGYLKYMNAGAIPKRIEVQIKLLLIYGLLRSVLDFLNNKERKEIVNMYKDICEEYIVKDEKIEWLYI